MTQVGTTPVPADRSGDALRSDAQQNRDRILAVAREALTASADASLNSIAKRAGVGPGTLYRHFPSREALVLAVYDADVKTLADSADVLLAQHPPLQALRLWFDRLAACGAVNSGLADALRSAAGDSLADATYWPVVTAVDQLLSACRRRGGIRSDIEAADVLLLLGFLGQIEQGTGRARRASRLLDLTMAGLQAGDPRARSGGAGGRGRSGRSRSPRLPRRLAFLALGAPRSH